METDSVFDYSTSIHKSLIQDDVQCGIGVIPLVFIIIITIILMRLVSIWCVFVGFVLFFVSKLLTRKDPHFLELLFERLLTSDIYRS
jgi:type IV secretory pathway VirB3-like protein